MERDVAGGAIVRKSKAPKPEGRRHGRSTNASVADGVEQKVVQFAEQLGWLVGTVSAKSEGWLDRKTLSAQVARIRDSAADLVTHLTPAGPETAPGPRKAGNSRSAPPSKQSAAATPSRDRGPVDGPGKRH